MNIQICKWQVVQFYITSSSHTKIDQLSLSPPFMNVHTVIKPFVFVLCELLPNSYKMKALARCNITPGIWITISVIPYFSDAVVQSDVDCTVLRTDSCGTEAKSAVTLPYSTWSLSTVTLGLMLQAVVIYTRVVLRHFSLYFDRADFQLS
jgi:hypothetical protein